MQHLQERIKQLSLADNKTISQIGLKLGEEYGELAKVLLPFDNADGTTHRFVDREKITEEIADVLLVTLSIAYKLKINPTKLDDMLERKMYRWGKLQEIPYNEAYPYEIHVTVREASSYEQFRNDCADIGVKPVVLDLHTKGNGIIKDVMTSSTLIGNNRTVIDEVERITYGLEDKGYMVVRQKVETVPWHPNTRADKTEDNYFEAHVPVTVQSGEEEDLYWICKRHPGTHVSRNALKKYNNDTAIFMVTIRHKDCDYETFTGRLHRLKEELMAEDYDCGSKDITEWAIYDNNVEHDKEWVEG